MRKVLLITGGSRGIGAAVTLRAAQQGYAVCINYVANAPRAEQIRQQVEQAGGTAIAVKADVAEESAVVAMFEQCDAQLGKVTHLVNNAGIITPRGRVEDCSAEGLSNMFGTNVIGPFLCAREAVRRMSTKHGGNGGAIVNISSVSARLGGAGRTVHYAASKSAVNTLTWGLAQEVAAEGIRVNTVSPGVTATEMNPASRLNELVVQIPMKRVGEADEVAAAVCWLLSDEASYVTGAQLTVSGGR